MGVHNPSIMEFGPARVISPDGTHRVPAELWGEFAALVLLEPEPLLLATWVRRLEDGLGVHDAHRRALETSPADVLAEIRTTQETKGLRSTAAEVKIELPDDQRGRSEFDLKRLDVLNARLAKGSVRRGKLSAEESREADLKERQGLERATDVKAEQKWARGAAAESAARATASGAQVSEDKNGVKRILDSDPLAGLTWLTTDQFEAGRVMRDCYLRRGEDAGAMEFTGMPGAAHDHERFVGSRFLRAKATNIVARTEIAVALDCRHEPAALAMLRAVCGEGKTLTSQGRGRAYDRNCKALAMALEIADSVIKRVR